MAFKNHNIHQLVVACRDGHVPPWTVIGRQEIPIQDQLGTISWPGCPCIWSTKHLS